ncbi:hypothetical protein GA0074696_4609 [Micromonospora purpureochromogenes]|uniref:Uncharacterized protein n=1 Tax=Micromonospora purpureochromogenes TaxID=47872 RepID=A0A1C4ZME8_9ACTN|nr:hypothetical protein [Micromonospora purpureochromogenes]SCF34059.1 hypothetical protein GA0074696_4609 [Micromonospora purpureochromogenes]
MNAHRMDQETVERLLVGPVVDPYDGPEPLVRLLTAVRAAPHPGELRGESAAMHAFRSARAGVPLPAPSPARSFPLARLAGLKVALAGLAVAATGGVALAAATGTLPGPLHRDAPVTPPSAAPQRTPPTTAGPGGSAAPPSDKPESSRPTPAASILGLCRSYRAAAADNPGRALDNPAFADLVTSAGGRDEVPGYCERVVRDARTSAPPSADHPTPTERPTSRPSPAPSTTAGKPDAPARTDPSRPTS